MRTWDEIAQLTHSLMLDQELTIRKMREVNTRYRGDYVIPFPDLAEEPALPPLTPQLVGEAVDQLGMRAAQVDPTMLFPAINPDKQRGKNSIEFAHKRQGAVAATYRASMWDLQRPRMFRQLVAYYTTAVVVLPDFKRKMPTVQVRDPLGTFAEQVDPSNPRPPEHVAFVTHHSGQSIRKRYPQTKSENGGPITDKSTNVMWEIVEWIDCDQFRWGLMGPVVTQGDHVERSWVQAPMMPLTPSYPNLAGVPLAVVPRQITLTGMASRLANMLGMVDLQGKLQGLEILAQEKAIYPDVYAIGRENGTPNIVGGSWKDGRTGDINILNDIDSVGTLRTDPTPMTQQTIDRQERNFRTSVGLSPMFGGESYGSLRTGRAIDAMTNMSVDPRIMELHKIAEAWQPYINTAIMETYSAFWPGKEFELPTGMTGEKARVKFRPHDHFETTDSDVVYPFPGADITQQTQILGSLLGTKGISLRTFREDHPWIGDAEGEAEDVRSEEIENALMQSVIMQIQQGALPIPVLSLIAKKLQAGKSLYDAIDDAQREIQEQQAAEAPPPEEGQVAAPETMPGMAGGPEALMQQAPEAAPQVEVPGDVERMRQLMQTMRG